MTPEPLSARNPRIARLRRLVTSRSQRRAEGRFVIEGPRLLAEALDAGVPVEEAFVAAGERRVEIELLDRLVGQGAQVWPVGGDLLARVGDSQTSQGVTAVAVAPSLVPPSGFVGLAPLVLVLVGVADPGNLGTVLRTADAAACDAVLLAGDCADPLSPKVVRSAAGALFRVRVAELALLAEPDMADLSAGLRRLLGEWGVSALGCVVREGVPLDEVDLTGPTALLLGSEAHGLPPAVEALLSQRLTIPMPGRAESLNVAMAATVVAFEAVRQRRAAGRAEDGGRPLNELHGQQPVGQG